MAGPADHVHDAWVQRHGRCYHLTCSISRADSVLPVVMQLPYLDAVFRETLRLCPPASLGASSLLQVIMLRNACQSDMTDCFT